MNTTTWLDKLGEESTDLVSQKQKGTQPFDAAACVEDIQAMVAEFGRRDPHPGIWEWVQAHRPELWQAHRAAMRELDAAFQARDGAMVMAAKGRALDAFNAMLEAWEHRGHDQPALLAA